MNTRKLCDEVGEKFDLNIGEFNQKLVGLHPHWNCQITFEIEDFETVVPWLDENREELTIFVHGLTDNHLKDHTDFAYWLGQEVKLNLSVF